MRNLIARALLPVAVGTTFVVPVGAALALSYHVAVREQQLLAGSIAGRMLDRANIVSEQIDHARAVLEDHPHERPCSPENIARMRELAIDASYLQAVGYVSGDRLLCSSYGEHGDGIPLGPADYLSSRGAWIRRSVELPFGSHRKFFVETDKWSGYSGLVLPDPILDAGRQDSQVSIALISISNRTVMLERGEVDVQKLPAFQREAGTVRWQAGDVGVIQFSASHDYAAAAA